VEVEVSQFGKVSCNRQHGPTADTLLMSIWDKDPAVWGQSDHAGISQLEDWSQRLRDDELKSDHCNDLWADQDPPIPLLATPNFNSPAARLIHLRQIQPRLQRPTRRAPAAHGSQAPNGEALQVRLGATLVSNSGRAVIITQASRAGAPLMDPSVARMQAPPPEPVRHWISFREAGMSRGGFQGRR